MIQFWLPKTASWTFLGTFGGALGPSNQNSGGSLLNVRTVFPSRPPFLTPTCIQSVPKGPPKQSKRSPGHPHHDPKTCPQCIASTVLWHVCKEPFVCFTIPLGMCVLPLLFFTPPCNKHCKFKKGKIGDTNLKVDLFLGAAVSRERLQ